VEQELLQNICHTTGVISGTGTVTKYMCHTTGATSGAGTFTEYLSHTMGATSGAGTVTEYLFMNMTMNMFHLLFLVLSSFMTYHRVCN
jgi:hypothetical protein